MRWFVFSFQCYCSTRSSSYSHVPRSGNHVSGGTCSDHGNTWSSRCKFRWINRHVCRTSHPPHTRREVKDPAKPGSVRQRGIWQWRACPEKVSCHSTKFISEHLLGVLAECEWSNFLFWFSASVPRLIFSSQKLAIWNLNQHCELKNETFGSLFFIRHTRIRSNAGNRSSLGGYRGDEVRVWTLPPS